MLRGCICLAHGVLAVSPHIAKCTARAGAVFNLLVVLAPKSGTEPCTQEVLINLPLPYLPGTADSL